MGQVLRLDGEVLGWMGQVLGLDGEVLCSQQSGHKFMRCTLYSAVRS